jgi:hypothetical protein
MLEDTAGEIKLRPSRQRNDTLEESADDYFTNKTVFGEGRTFRIIL